MRYKQTIVGVAWAFFQPVITMVIFTIFFGSFVGVPSDGIPYPIFVFTGLILWHFFSGALSEVSGCLVANKHLITKIYFPRTLLLFGATATRLVDMVIASFVLAGLMVYYRYLPDLESIIVIPVLVLWMCIFVFGFGAFLAAVNVKYRDVRYALPFFIQSLLYVTPVIYPVSITGKYEWLLWLNPMTAIVHIARSVLLRPADIPAYGLLLSIGVTLVLVALGVRHYLKTERFFADVI